MHKRILLIIAFIFAVCCVLLPGAVRAQSIAQSYKSQGTLQRAMVVGLTKADKSAVEAVGADAVDRMYGVVVSGGDVPITVTGGANEVLVVTGGKNDILVSNENGEIKVGDYLTASSVAGIAMKATPDQATVIGRALATFKDASSGRYVSSLSVKDNKNTTQKVEVGLVLADIAVVKNPLAKNSSNIPSFLKSASESVVGKQVSMARVYVSIVIMLVSGAIAGGLIYSGVRGSIISIGRNPLSRTSILRSLFQVILVSTVIFFSGLVGVYLLLKI